MKKCNDIGLVPADAIQISGHKNVASANSYSRLNEQQQKSINAVYNIENTKLCFHDMKIKSLRNGGDFGKQRSADSLFTKITTITS